MLCKSFNPDKNGMSSKDPWVVQGGGTSPMKGVDGAEASASALIHDLASLLQCDPSPAQALPVLKAVSGAIDQLLPRLPPSFLEPILPPNSLNNHQVCFHNTHDVWCTSVVGAKVSIATPNQHHLPYNASLCCEEAFTSPDNGKAQTAAEACS